MPPGKDSRTKVKHATPRAASVPVVPEPARGGDPVEIEVAGETHRLEAGDSILFEADSPHAYRNAGRGEAVMYLVMTYAEAVG